MINKNIKSYIDDINGWDHPQNEFQVSDIFSNYLFPNFKYKSFEREENKKKKQKKTILPNLSNQKIINKHTKTYHKCSFIKECINQNNKKKNLPRNINISSQRFLLHSKYKKNNPYTLSFQDFHNKIQNTSKYQRIKKQLQEKKKNLNQQAYILRLKGSKILSNQISKNISKEQKKIIKSKEKSIDQQKIQKMQDQRVDWWKNFLEQKKVIKNIKKHLKGNFSQQIIKISQEHKKQMVMSKIKQKYIEKNKIQKFKMKENICFYKNIIQKDRDSDIKEK